MSIWNSSPFKNDSTFGKCEQMSWTLLGLRDLSTAIRRQPHSCDLRISLGWKDSDTSDSIACHLEGFQQLSRYLSWTCGWWQSVTGEQLQHRSLFCHHGAQHPDRLTLQPALRSSTYPCLQPQTPIPALLLSPCFLYASWPSLSVCRGLRWTSADALLGSSYCHQRGWYPATVAPCSLPSPRRISQVIPLKDAVLKNPGWVWLWEKDKSFPCCRCCFAVVFLHSRSLLVFIKKDPCIINIVHPSIVTIKQTPYFHTTHDLQGYR